MLVPARAAIIERAKRHTPKYSMAENFRVICATEGAKHKHQKGEQAAQEGEYHSGTQSLARLTLFGHGGAIEAGGDGGGGAGDVDEDGRDQAAGDPADVERHE